MNESMTGSGTTPTVLGEPLSVSPRGTVQRIVEVWGTVIVLEVAFPDMAADQHAGGITAELSDDLRDALMAALDESSQIMLRIDQIFSTYRADSIISDLRLGARDEADLDLSNPDEADVILVIDQCRRLKATTDGAFDPWAARGGFDPSGYVKGWGAGLIADRLWRATRDRGAVGVCVNAGGDVSVRGTQADSTPWTVGIRHPDEPDKLVRVVQATSGHVATSGYYERGEHIVTPSSHIPHDAVGAEDPTTHSSSHQGRCRSATVWGPDDGAADALATALLIGGREAAVWFSSVQRSDTGMGREISRWGAFGVDDEGAFRIGELDSLVIAQDRVGEQPTS